MGVNVIRLSNRVWSMGRQVGLNADFLITQIEISSGFAKMNSTLLCLY